VRSDAAQQAAPAEGAGYHSVKVHLRHPRRSLVSSIGTAHKEAGQFRTDPADISGRNGMHYSCGASDILPLPLHLCRNAEMNFTKAKQQHIICRVQAYLATGPDLPLREQQGGTVNVRLCHHIQRRSGSLLIRQTVGRKCQLRGPCPLP